MHRANHPPRPARQRGTSLIELMVGLVIGIICVLVILQVLSLWEARKRTTSAGSDAQVSGTLASFTLDRDLRAGGYGFGTAATPGTQVMGCSVIATRSGTDVSFPLRPVQITPGTNDGPDEIRVLYGNSAYFVASQPFTGSTPETKRLKMREGFNPGDRAVVAGNMPATDCQLIEVTGMSAADLVTIEHLSGKSYTLITGGAQTSTMNPATGTGATFSTGFIYNLGPAPVLNVWSVDRTTGSLRRYNFLAESSTSAVDVASDVVTLKAEYGIDTSLNGEIEAGEWTKTTTPTTDWSLVRAVRYGLLVRSRQYERPRTESGVPVPVTPVAPSWAGGAFVMKNVDGSDDSGNGATALSTPNNWRNYRYRVYESVVPLRNMIWGAAP